MKNIEELYFSNPEFSLIDIINFLDLNPNIKRITNG